jgi:hypothetical protein
MLICQCTREILTAARTYYVRTDGNDSNDGLANTAAGAFLTIQKAVDVALNTLDFGGFDVTIQIGDGSYSAGANILGPQVGKGILRILGNATTPSNVVVTATNANGFSFDRGIVAFIRDLEVRTVTSGVSIRSLGGSTVTLANIVFGSAATYHMLAFSGGTLFPQDYTIAGGALTHLSVTFGGLAWAENRTITLTGTPNFSTSFLYVETGGVYRAAGLTFSGSATGTRYFVYSNGVVQTATAGPNLNYFPGNVAGVANTGGQYV